MASKKKSARFPEVPADWTTNTSAEQWIPNPVLRAELARLAKSTLGKPPAAAKKIWAQTDQLLPTPLRRVIPGTPWRWGNVASPEVARTAVALLVHAATGNDAGRVEAELTRILPDGPAICLPDVVGEDVYVKAIQALSKRKDFDSSDDLKSLMSFLTST